MDVTIHTRGYNFAWVGRALEWHSRGQRFDPAYLHQSEKAHQKVCFFIFFRRGRTALAIPERLSFSKGRASGGIPNLLPLAKVFDHAYFYGKRAWSAFSFH